MLQRPRTTVLLGLAAALLLAPMPAWGHADIIARIAALDEQIAAAPDDTALILKRGELHRLHRDWPAALADYDHGARLDPGDPAVLFYRGRMWFEAGNPDRARPLLDRFIAARPGHADAYLTRSRVLSRLGDHLAAAADLDRAIALLDPPTPEVYLDRARALAAAGPQHIDPALKTLDRGTARLGQLVTLTEYAIELERSRQRHHQALARLDTLPPVLARQPSWLAVRGDILREMGEPQGAAQTYRTALARIEAYPASRRNTRAVAALEERLRAALP